MGGKPRTGPDAMSISREVCRRPLSPNANPSHLHLRCRNPILRLVKTTDSPAVSTFLPLADLRRGEFALVAGLAEVAGFDDGHGSSAVLLARLRDLGFVAGARCEVIARMWPAGDPLVVRVGGSTFALRRAEAAAVRVTRLGEQPAMRAQVASKDTGAALA
jgi:Fe2+ transport system protein FeoA